MKACIRLTSGSLSFGYVCRNQRIIRRSEIIFGTNGSGIPKLLLACWIRSSRASISADVAGLGTTCLLHQLGYQITGASIVVHHLIPCYRPIQLFLVESRYCASPTICPRWRCHRMCIRRVGTLGLRYHMMSFSWKQDLSSSK